MTDDTPTFGEEIADGTLYERLLIDAGYPQDDDEDSEEIYMSGQSEMSVRIRYKSEAFESAASVVSSMEGWCVRARWHGQTWLDCKVRELVIDDSGFYNVVLVEVDNHGDQILGRKTHHVDLYAHGFELVVE